MAVTFTLDIFKHKVKMGCIDFFEVFAMKIMDLLVYVCMCNCSDPSMFYPTQKSP